MSKIFLLLWLVFEPLLFGVIGCQIDIISLSADTILKGLVCISLGLIVSVIELLGPSHILRVRLIRFSGSSVDCVCDGVEGQPEYT